MTNLNLIVRALPAGLLLTAGALCQTTAPASEFAVASVKAAAPGARGYSIQPLPGGLHVVNCTLKQMVAEAFKVFDFQVAGGPKWMESDRFDIEAKTAGEGKASKDELRAMLKSLLTERFQLAAHTESKETTVLALSIGKSGMKFQESKDSVTPPYFRVYQRRQITAQRAPLEYLTETLSQLLGRVVTDETGLKGIFDYKLEWTPDEFQAASAENATVGEANTPSLAAALQEQMGLRMDTKRGPSTVVVVDRAERPGGN